MIFIEPPSISGKNDRETLQQLKSYLYKTAQQLQWAFDTLEQGSPSPAPAGKTQQAVASVTPKTLFPGLKDLIIKSADIVDAYSQKIGDRMEGRYTAVSDFGTYCKKTDQRLEEDGQMLQQIYKEQETLTETVDGLYNSSRTTEAYLKTGLLDRDSEDRPIYGLEIGQANQQDGVQLFERFARFTANRLSFFDSAQVEVAWISDYKLCITNAEITGNLTIGGRFKIFSGQGLVFQWTGGSQ